MANGKRRNSRLFIRAISAARPFERPSRHSRALAIVAAGWAATGVMFIAMWVSLSLSAR